MGAYRYILRGERDQIEIMLRHGYSSKRIAERMKMSKSTINREIRRGMDPNGDYDACLAQEAFERGIKRRGRRLPAPAGAGRAEGEVST